MAGCDIPESLVITARTLRIDFVEVWEMWPYTSYSILHTVLYKDAMLRSGDPRGRRHLLFFYI